MSKKFISVLVATLLLAGAIGSSIFYIYKWTETPIHLEEEVMVTLTKGESLRALSEDMEAKGLITNAMLFQYWIKFQKNSYAKFQAGNYRFEHEVSPKEIMETMVEGKTYNPIALEFTIPEGWNFAQIRNLLISLNIGTEEEYLQIANDPQWLEKMGIPLVEGFLYPVKYVFHHQKPTPQEVLERMVKEFFARLPSNYEEDLKVNKLTMKEWVTFASLIERETAQPEEHVMISEVIWNRLKAGIPIGIDAALIYGIKNYNGNITRADLQDRKNPYNNRIYKGLPPTPIGSPTTVSLTSVFYPTSEGFSYFVLVPGPERKHHFSKSFQEHSLYVQDLVRAQRAVNSSNKSLKSSK